MRSVCVDADSQSSIFAVGDELEEGLWLFGAFTAGENDAGDEHPRFVDHGEDVLYRHGPFALLEVLVVAVVAASGTAPEEERAYRFSSPVYGAEWYKSSEVDVHVGSSLWGPVPYYFVGIVFSNIPTHVGATGNPGVSRPGPAQHPHTRGSYSSLYIRERQVLTHIHEVPVSSPFPLEASPQAHRRCFRLNEIHLTHISVYFVLH